MFRLASRIRCAFAWSLLLTAPTIAFSQDANHAVEDARHMEQAMTRYEVASVRQNLNPEPRWRLEFTDDGVRAMDVTLFYAMQEAYGLYDEQFWFGIPAWTKRETFRH